MSEALTFANYNPVVDGIDGIYGIGAEDQGKGVIEEIAEVVDHRLNETPNVSDLGELISKVAPEKELLKNVKILRDALDEKGYPEDTPRTWVEKSGLLTPVSRYFFSGAEYRDDPIDLAVVTSGLRNWMMRRVERLGELAGHGRVDKVILVAGSRVMSVSEGDDIEEGMTESGYMHDTLSPHLSANINVAHEEVEVDAKNSEEVVLGAAKAAERLLSGVKAARIAIVSNASNWITNVGQFRRAAQSLEGLRLGNTFDYSGKQLIAISDGPSVGADEEQSGHLSAVEMIVRNAQELARCAVASH